MDRSQWILAERASRARLYDDMLIDLGWLQTPVVPDGYIHGYQGYVCLFRPEPPTLANVDRLHWHRNDLMTRLEEKGIATRQGTHAPVIVDYYAKKYDLRPEEFPNAYLADRLSLTLPLYASMTDADQALVCESLCEAFDV
jgi:perosamine synthetase